MGVWQLENNLAPRCASCLSRHILRCPRSGSLTLLRASQSILRKRSANGAWCGRVTITVYGCFKLRKLPRCCHGPKQQTKSYINLRYVQEDFNASRIILSLMLQLLSGYFRTTATFYEAQNTLLYSCTVDPTRRQRFRCEDVYHARHVMARV